MSRGRSAGCRRFGHPSRYTAASMGDSLSQLAIHFSLVTQQHPQPGRRSLTSYNDARDRGCLMILQSLETSSVMQVGRFIALGSDARRARRL
jgi:hypothetical protein